MKARYRRVGNSNKSGVYKIICMPTQKFYIGSTSCFRKRKYQHLKKLRIGKHYNKPMQNAFNKYGEENFEFHTLEINGKGKQGRLKCEEKYLKKLHDNQKFCFNIYKNPTSCEGRVFSKTPEKTRREISESIKRLWKDPEYRKRMIEAHSKRPSPNKGRKFSKKHKKSLSESHKGKTGTKSSHYKTYDVDLISPKGKIYKGPLVCVAEFARKHKLCSRHLRLLVVGKAKTCKGWKRYE